MRARSIYSRWDGSQRSYSLEADQALDELSRFMSEGLSPREALDWMRDAGFDLAGMDFRVMGMDELLQELRQQAQEMMSRFNMDSTFDERRERLRDILDREERAVREQKGVESRSFGDFKQREEKLPRRLSAAVERFRDYEWTDEDAESEYRELLEELEDTQRLEQFSERNQFSLQGPEDLSFEQARDLMNQVEALSQMIQDLMEGNFQRVSPDDLREMLGEDAARSFVMIRDLQSSLEGAGYLREGAGGLELTPRAIRRLGELALDDIYASLHDGDYGSHDTRHRGTGVVTIERTHPYQFGEAANIDPIGTVRNALRRVVESPAEVRGRARRVDLSPRDLEVFDTDLLTETTTVLLLDMSWSMSFEHRWGAAKRVAVAMDHLIRTRYPRDRFFIVGFYTTARELRIQELPELAWNMSDPFTNLQDGLRVAQRLIDRHPNPNKQIIVITDGQPTAYFVEGELHVEWPSGRGGISPVASRETLKEVRRVTKQEITINTFMLDNSPELLQFVEAMTRINRGRAFYTTPEQIGQYIMVDYLDRKRKRIR